MKNIDFDKTWIGFFIGLIAPCGAFVLFYLIKYRYMSVDRYIEFMKIGDIYTPIISLCVLVNLGIFYLFLNKEKFNGAKGVIASTFVWAALIVYLKFFT